MGVTRRRTPGLSATLRGADTTVRFALSLVVALAVSALASVAMLPASALAVTAPIALDAPDNGEAPLIAYDPVTQTTYVAWSDPQHPGVDLCVLPVSSTDCEGGAPVLLEDSKYAGYTEENHPGLGGLVVLPGGETVVIGTPVSAGSIAWASPPGGAAFLSGSQGLQNGGKFISPVSLFYTFGNAVALNSTDVGLLDDYGNFFSDSPFAGPESPTPAASTNPGGQYERKALDTDGPEIAAEAAPAPAPAGTDVVVGVGQNDSSLQLTPTGCLNDAATGYGVSAGVVNGSSKATGTLNKEGLPAYQLLACSAEAPVLAQGGQDGIGVLEEEGNGIDGAGSDFQVVYHPFIATATGGSFGPGIELSDVTGEVLDGVDSIDLSEDSGTGVYALWESGRAIIDYSSNGGATWDGPVASPFPYTADGVIAGVGNGTAELAYENNPGTGNQVYLQAVNYAELATPAPTADTLTTSQTSGSSTGASIEITAGTVGETDHATLAGANVGIATGTVSYALYSTPTCSGPSVFSNTTAVAGGVAGPSSAITTALSPGTYYWRAAYSGDARNDASASACGSEVLTVVPAVVIEGAAPSSGTSVTITVSCPSAEPCTISVTVTATEITIVVKKASAARKKVVHKRTITLATGKFTIPGKSTKKLQLKLTKAGKRLLKREHGHLKASVRISDKTPGGLELTARTIAIHTVKPKHK
jgi:hypothetical protein